MSIPTLHTPRLVLRPFVDDDLDRFAAIHADPEVMRWIGDGQPLTRAQAWRTMATIVGHWALRGYGPWAVEEKASGTVVGRVGPWFPDGWPGLELTWTLDPAFWGRGFASEAARAALRWTFAVLDAERVISLIEPTNERSLRVAAAIGEVYAGRTALAGTWAPPREVAIYAIERGAATAG
jgi:RimJ/RimL family protein N-acetyltransferase